MSEHICPVHDWKIKWPLITDKASESNSVIAIATWTGSAAAALIIGVVVVIVVLRKRMANAKGIMAFFCLDHYDHMAIHNNVYPFYVFWK